MDFGQLRDIDWQLLFIRTYTWVSTMYALLTTQTQKSVKYLVNSFYPEIYCLYTGSSVPVRLDDYKKDVAGVASIDFYYNRDQRLLCKSLDANTIPRTLNIEGASIYHGDICLYDLTDFFDTTYYSGGSVVPSLDQWVGIWELENGIYLDRNKDFQIQVEFLGESREIFQLWRGSRTRWNELTSNGPRLHRQALRPTFSNCSCVPQSNTCCSTVENTVTDLSGSSVILSNSQVSDISGNSVDLSGNVVEEVPQT